MKGRAARQSAVMVRAAGAVVARPTLWPTAIRQWWRLVPRRWWMRRPFVPVPDRAWLRFRLETQYGSAGGPPTGRDVVAWLEWCRDFPR